MRGEAKGLLLGRSCIGRGNLLVMSRVALSCVLLISGGLFLRSMQFARAVDPGFDRAGIAMFSIDFDLHGYDATRGKMLQHNVAQRLRAIPGVASASYAAPLPLGSVQLLYQRLS